MRTTTSAAPVYTPSKRTASQLQGEIVLWANRIPVGSEWKHWSGTVFEITGHGVNIETGQIEVQYQEASLGERPQPRYTVGSIAPINPDVILHRPADDWENDVTIHNGQVLPVDVVASMTPHEKLILANERRVVPRHRRVQRVEQFVEISK